MCKYISYNTIGVITYTCPNLSQTIEAKRSPKLLDSLMGTRISLVEFSGSVLGHCLSNSIKLLQPLCFIANGMRYNSLVCKDLAVATLWRNSNYDLCSLTACCYVCTIFIEITRRWNTLEYCWLYVDIPTSALFRNHIYDIWQLLLEINE